MIEITQWFAGKFIPKIYQQCMNQVKSMVPLSWKYNLIIGEGNHQRAKYKSNIIRKELLLENSMRWWIDSDVLILKSLDELLIKENMPYCYDGNCYATSIFGNGCTETLNEVFSKQKGNDCLCEVIKEHINTFEKIPKEYMLHLHLSRLIETGKMENDFCKLKRDINGELVFEKINGFDVEKLI
jgi:hypothetical protein